MIDKLAVFMEFSGYSKDELEAYLSLKFGSMTRGGLTASILSSSGYQKAKSVIFDQTDLNKNQQIVLEWLKKNSEWGTPTGLIYELAKRNSIAAEYIITAHDQLNDLEQFQLLAAFADWGKEEVAK